MEMSSEEQGVACVQVCNIKTCSASMHSSIIGASTIYYDRLILLDCFGKSSILQFRIQIRLFGIPYLGIAYKQANLEQTDN